jgi:hypothetical protein
LQEHIFFQCSCNLKNPNIWTLGNKVDNFVCKITLFLRHSCTDASWNRKKVTPNIFYYINELCMTCISKLPSCKLYRRTCSQSAPCLSRPQIDSETEGRRCRSKITRLAGPGWLYVKAFSLNPSKLQSGMFIPDPGPGSVFFPSRIPGPDPDPGSRGLKSTGSWIQGSKKHRILDPGV